MKISIITCTLNPKEKIFARVLEALRAQTLPKEEWEFLVVDNRSEPPLAGRTDLSWHPGGRIIREEEPGKMAAWIHGMKAAQGDLLVFVDDDNVLAEDYLETVLKISARWPFIGAWGGNVIPEFEIPLPDWCQSQRWRLSIGEVSEAVWSNRREGFETKPLGAGMCIRKSVAERYLQWSASNPVSKLLDRNGNLVTGYGEMDLSNCAIDIGLGTAITPELKLTHLIPRSRITLEYFSRQAEGDAISFFIYRTLRRLPVKNPKLSWQTVIRRRLHWMLKRTPYELREIAKAHQRGCEKGWETVQKMLSPAHEASQDNPGERLPLQ